VLSDEGVPRAITGYRTAHGVVCAALHGRDSFIVREDGGVEPHASWPRPICAILPLGDGGSVAWNNGTDAWPERSSGYVMYRPTADAPIHTEDLTVEPSMGAWFRERLYWVLFPRGLASWTPGGPVRVIDDSITLLAAHDDGANDVLQLAACERAADGNLVRGRVPRGWRLGPGDRLDETSYGVDGASSCRSADMGWTAVVYPEADRIALSAPDGIRASLACYYPYQAVWLGESLLVSTVHGELLLFEQLREAIGALTR
jgi:hypothetical protein